MVILPVSLIKTYLFSLLIFFFVSSCEKGKYLYYEPESQFPLPFVNILVNDQQIKAYLDTGMQSNALLSNKLLEEIGDIKFIDRKRYKDADGEVFYTYRCKVKLKFFDTVYDSLTIDAISHLTKGQDSEGQFNNLPLMSQSILGLGVLKKNSFILDLSRNFISFDMQDIKLFSHYKKIIFPFKITENGIEIKIYQKNKVISAVIDTGCSGSVLRKKSLKKLKPSIKRINNKYYIKLGDYKGVTIDEFPCEIMDQDNLNIDILLGCDFLRMYTIVFDFKNNLLCLLIPYISFTGCD